MEYVLVGLFMSSPGVYDVASVAEYKTMAQCEQQLEANRQKYKQVYASLVCAKKDWN